MAGFAQRKDDLQALDIAVFAASVDARDKALEVADEVGFAIGYGVTRAMGDALGSWWDTQRDFIQPSEFLLDHTGKVIASSYSAGPLGRFDAAEVVRMVRRREKLAAQASASG